MLVLPSERQDQARAKVADCIKVANEYFACTYPEPDVLFNLRGHVAGRAYLKRWCVRLNTDLLVANPERVLHQTVPHEVAHLITFKQYGNVAPHGYEWQHVMRQVYGRPPDRCHNMKTTPARVVPRHRVYCNCEDNSVTSIVLKRMQKGSLYECRRCRQLVTLQPAQPRSFDDLLTDIK